VGLKVRRISDVKFFTLLAFLIILICFYMIGFRIWVSLNPEKEINGEMPGDYGLVYEDVEFLSVVDGTELKGWWLPAQEHSFELVYSKDTIIFSHGFGDSRTKMPIKSLKLAARLTSEGYNVLMYDFRNSGESGGKLTTIGYYEKYDVLSAIDFAKKKGSDNIGLLGWSMGASASILATNGSEDVMAVVADSPFSDFDSYLGDQLNYWTRLPNKLSPVLLKSAEFAFGFDYSNVSPKEVIKNNHLDGNNVPILLIHGKKDNAISYLNSVELKGVDPNIDVWLIEGVGHIRGYKHKGDIYENRLVDFYNKHLKQKDIQHMYVLLFILSWLLFGRKRFAQAF
jgi:uncharacterized protein